MNGGRAIVLQGDARRLPLPDESVDLIVTSPPYFALRSYQDDGEHYDGQIGSEASPMEWLDAMLECTAEWIRVLKPTGSMFVNLGDKYSDRAGPEWAGSSDRFTGRPSKPRRRSSTQMAPRKSLLGLPWRYALGCVDELDLILRAEIVWDKPNPLPESVDDRVKRAHEQWFHLVKQPRYFAAVDEIREPYAPGSKERIALGFKGDPARDAARISTGYVSEQSYDPNPLGKMPGSVWQIPSEPLSIPERIAHGECCGGRKRPGCEDGIDHYAAYPTAWPKRLILGWSPSGICVECGEGRRPLANVEQISTGRTNSGRAKRQDAFDPGLGRGFNGRGYSHTKRATTITGYICACAAPTAATRQAVVLDPFGGTGTTALVARALGRVGISVDLSHDYCRIARWRTSDRAQLAKVLGVAKPPTEVEQQLGLFESAG